MNKKLATLLFAIGVGAASSAYAWPDPECGRGCWETYMHCRDSGTNMEYCEFERIECQTRCGI